ncbi:MAG: hypothetical protein RSB62_10015 [Bacteroides sp.]
MDNVVDRNVPIADENIDPNGRPAKNKFGNWSDGVSKTIHDPADDPENLTPEEREKRIKEMEEIIKKEIE